MRRTSVWWMSKALRDPTEAVLLANEAVCLLPRGDTWNTLGLACYRAGQLPDPRGRKTTYGVFAGQKVRYVM